MNKADKNIHISQGKDEDPGHLSLLLFNIILEVQGNIIR